MKLNLALFFILLMHQNMYGISVIAGHHSFKLTDQAQQRLMTIIHHVQHASAKEMLSALYCLKYYLQHTSSSSLHMQFITHCRLQHIENAIYHYKTMLSWWERSRHYLSHAYQSLQHRRSSCVEWKKLCTSHSLASAMLDYLTFEDEYFLASYSQALTFFFLCNKYQELPYALNFWSDPVLQKECAYRLSRGVTKIKPQSIAAIGGFIANQAIHLAPVALQATLMGGQSMYSQWMSKKSQEKMALLTEQQKNLRTSYQEFLKQQDESQAQKVSSIIHTFIDDQKKLNKSYEEFAHKEQQNYAYLLQSINLAQPASHYLRYPISFDQLFAAGIMNTPLKEQYPWYNIYQKSSGDWGFYQGSFYQRSLVNYGTPYWAGGTANPEAIAIFNEWTPRKVPYSIVVEMRIIRNEYPFFIGIMLNKARWISGDPERINDYHLIGLHAQSADDLAFWSSHQVITFQKNTEHIASPLERIANRKAQVIKKINPLKATVLLSESLTYRLEFVIDKNSINYVIKEKSSAESLLSMGTLMTPQKNYHGFGFIAAGCQACFTILQPIELSYKE